MVGIYVGVTVGSKVGAEIYEHLWTELKETALLVSHIASEEMKEDK